MRKPGRFGRNILSNAGGNALISALQLGLLCVLFRIMDDLDYAAFLTAGYLVGPLEIASDYGVRLWATREFSVTDNPRAVMRQSWKIKIFYTVLAAIALSLLPLNTLTLGGFLLCTLIAATQPGTDPFLWHMRGRERLDIEAVVVIGSRVAIVAGMAVGAIVGLPLTGLLWIWLGGNIMRLAVEWRLPISQPLFVRPVEGQSTLQPIRRTIAAVFPLGTALVLTCIFQRTSLYVLEAYATVHDYKIYATAFKFVSTSGAIATAIFVSSFAPLTRAVEASDTDAVRAVVRRKMVLVTAVFLPVCVFGILLVVPLSGWFSSQSLTDVASVMVLLMPGLYVSCVNMGLKFTLNAFELNWHDVTAVLLGLTTLLLATTFHGNLSWWTAGALGWFVGESTLLMARLWLLYSQKKHLGVPVGMIFGSAAALLLMVVFLR